MKLLNLILKKLFLEYGNFYLINSSLKILSLIFYQKAYFCDNNAKSIAVIKDNIKRAHVDDRAVVMHCGFLQALEQIKTAGDKIDIAFLDPPYNTKLAVKALENIVRLGLLNDDGYIIAEQAADEPELNIDGLAVKRVKDYKTTKMTYLEKI